MMPKIPVVSITTDGERTRYPSIKEAAKAVRASTRQINDAIYFCWSWEWLIKKDGEGE